MGRAFGVSIPRVFDAAESAAFLGFDVPAWFEGLGDRALSLLCRALLAENLATYGMLRTVAAILDRIDRFRAGFDATQRAKFADAAAVDHKSLGEETPWKHAVCWTFAKNLRTLYGRRPALVVEVPGLEAVARYERRYLDTALSGGVFELLMPKLFLLRSVANAAIYETGVENVAYGLADAPEAIRLSGARSAMSPNAYSLYQKELRYALEKPDQLRSARSKDALVTAYLTREYDRLKPAFADTASSLAGLGPDAVRRCVDSANPFDIAHYIAQDPSKRAAFARLESSLHPIHALFIERILDKRFIMRGGDPSSAPRRLWAALERELFREKPP